MKSKTAEACLNAFKDILKTVKEPPLIVMSDKVWKVFDILKQLKYLSIQKNLLILQDITNSFFLQRGVRFKILCFDHSVKVTIWNWFTIKVHIRQVLLKDFKDPFSESFTNTVLKMKPSHSLIRFKILYTSITQGFIEW